MKLSSFTNVLAAASFILCLPAHATPADAQKLQRNYQLSLDRWTAQFQAAKTPEEKNKIWNSRPDAAPYARDLWTQIGGDLDQDWTLEPAAWFIRTTPGLLTRDETGSPRPIFSKENDAIRKAIEAHHLASKKLLPICAALAAAPDPRSVSLLEKIQEKNPDPEIQGVAAIAAAIQLKTLGEAPDIMQRRLTYIRKAIKQAANVQLNEVPVSKLAEDELYIIRFLSKGREAPDLVGTDTAGRAFSLASNQGKIIVLLFWNSNLPDSQRIVDIATAMDRKYKGRPVTILGVNNDTNEKLRSLQANGAVSFTNFSDPDNKLAPIYRVGTWPLVYVLDGQRKIHFAGAPGSFVEATADALLEDMKKAPASAPKTPGTAPKAPGTAPRGPGTPVPPR